MWVKMEDKHEDVEDIESGLSDSFIEDDDNDDSDNDDDNEPSTSGQDDGTRIQVFFFFFFAVFLLLLSVIYHCCWLIVFRVCYLLIWILLFLDISIWGSNSEVQTCEKRVSWLWIVQMTNLELMNIPLSGSLNEHAWYKGTKKKNEWV